MTEKKLHVALLFGGNSSEHDVSKRSAHNIYDGMDKDKYDVSIFMFTKDGILLDNEALANQMGKAGRQRVLQQFSWASIAKTTLTYYQEVIDRFEKEKA